MSWFDASAISSLAKNAIKEAQKTIDKALDIREDEPPNTSNTISPIINKQLKEESESFFANFGLSDKPECAGLSEDSSNNEGKNCNEENVARGKMVGSLWGSFTGSFFEGSKTELKEKGSNKSAVGVITPTTDTVVATQPPRNISNLPESSQSVEYDDSSKSSSIIQLSVENVSSGPSSSLPSPFMEEIQSQCIKNETILPHEEAVGTTTRDVGWEWGWDSSIIVMSPDSKLKCEDDSIPQEESLVDDAMDNEGFAKTRLIVGSVDSESSSLPRESLNSLNSSKSLPDIDSRIPVVEEVFAEPLNAKRSSSPSVPPLEIPCRQDAPLESPDSIILLDSNLASPIDASVAFPGAICKPHLLDVPLNEEDNSFDIPRSSPGIESPLSPSSIEVLSGSSTEVTSPTSYNTCSHTASEYSVNSTDPIPKTFSELDEQNSNTVDTVSSSPDNVWKTTRDEQETHAITKQPLSLAAKTIHQEEGNALSYTFEEGKSQGRMNLTEEAEEIFHSNTTSCTVSTVEDSSQTLDFEESTRQATTSLTSTDHDDHATSMNAAEIRKNLDRVEKDPIWGVSAIQDMREGDDDQSSAREDESSDVSLPSVTILEMSSRSESSTETVTASMDSQHMAWSDIVDSQREESGWSKTQEKEGETEVQEMLEEAMDDTSQTITETEEMEGDHPTDIQESPDTQSTNVDRDSSPTSSDRSDAALKVCSSSPSSADEMETATSSDIEVISSPSIDGSSNGNSRSSFGVPTSVAAKVWMSAQRGLRTFINEKPETIATSGTSGSHHRRDNGNGHQGETVPSSMTTSFTSISESEGDSPLLPHSELLQLEASRLTQILLQDLESRDKGHRRNKSNLSETSESSSELQTLETEKLFRKMSQLTEILESRETKVLELSHLNATLQDANTNLKSRLDELEGLRNGSENTECLREEFTQRLVAMERKFQQALREKETIQKQLEEYKLEVASRRSHADVTKEIEDRETMIVELRKEGEKLSKQQLSYSNIVKKLRAKEKENDTLIQDQREKMESLSIDLERLRKQLNAKEEVERRQIDAIRQLTMVTQRQEETIKVTTADNAELEGKLSTLKEALDTAYKEMGELERSTATRDAEAQKAALSVEISAREKAESAMEETINQNKRQQEALLAQIHELQDTLSRSEAQSNRKERQLKAELQDLHQRLSEAEARTDEMSNSVSAATRPLLRQMENIQASQMAQQVTWESMEESLTKRLQEAQSAASVSAKREREAKEHLSSTMTEISSLQSQIASLQAENTQLKTKLEVYTLKATALEEAKVREANQLEALKTSFADEILEVKRERDVLEQQLEIEKTAANAERRKSAAFQEQLKDKERKMSQIQMVANPVPAGESRTSSPRSSPTPSLSRFSLAGSINDSFLGSHWGDEVFDPSWGSQRNTSLYDSMRSNSASTVDALTSALRQREGEVHHLQRELTRLEAQKESLAQELVQSSKQLEEHVEKLEYLEELKNSQKDMEQKYNALLQMYGEKVEEVEELRLDLEDVKEMYKLQIDQLMRK